LHVARRVGELHEGRAVLQGLDLIADRLAPDEVVLAAVGDAVLVVAADGELGRHETAGDAHDLGVALVKQQRRASNGQVQLRLDAHAGVWQGLNPGAGRGLPASPAVGGPVERQVDAADRRRGQHPQAILRADGVAAGDLEDHLLSLGAGRRPDCLEPPPGVQALAGWRHVVRVVGEDPLAVAGDLKGHQLVAVADVGGKRDGLAGHNDVAAFGADKHDMGLGRPGGLDAVRPGDRAPGVFAGSHQVHRQRQDHRAGGGGCATQPAGRNRCLHVNVEDLPGRPALYRRQAASHHVAVPVELEGGRQVVAQVGMRFLDHPRDVEVVEPADERADDKQRRDGRLRRDQQAPQQQTAGAGGQPAWHQLVGHDADSQEQGIHTEHQQRSPGDVHHVDAPLGQAQTVFDAQLAVGLTESPAHGPCLILRLYRHTVPAATVFRRSRRRWGPGAWCTCLGRRLPGLPGRYQRYPVGPPRFHWYVRLCGSSGLRRRCGGLWPGHATQRTRDEDHISDARSGDGLPLLGKPANCDGPAAAEPDRGPARCRP